MTGYLLNLTCPRCGADVEHVNAAPVIAARAIAVCATVAGRWLGRDSIGIDLNERNADLAQKRVQGYGLLQVVERDGRALEVEGQGVLL